MQVQVERDTSCSINHSFICRTIPALVFARLARLGILPEEYTLSFVRALLVYF